MHPGYEGLNALPYYDEFDLGTVDVLLISQYVVTFPRFFHSPSDGSSDGASYRSGLDKRISGACKCNQQRNAEPEFRRNRILEHQRGSVNLSVRYQILIFNVIQQLQCNDLVTVPRLDILCSLV